MPFGIAKAPALFQELMNQVIALCKRRPAAKSSYSVVLSWRVTSTMSSWGQ